MTGHTPFSNLVKQMSKRSQKRAEKEREELQKKYIRSVTLEFPSNKYNAFKMGGNRIKMTYPYLDKEAGFLLGDNLAPEEKSTNFYPAKSVKSNEICRVRIDKIEKEDYTTIHIHNDHCDLVNMIFEQIRLYASTLNN